MFGRLIATACYWKLNRPASATTGRVGGIRKALGRGHALMGVDYFYRQRYSGRLENSIGIDLNRMSILGVADGKTLAAGQAPFRRDLIW